MRGIRALAWGALLIGAVARAYETDPYTNRHIDLADGLAVMDAKVNDALDAIAAGWDGGEDEWAFVTAVYWTIGGLHWVDKLERWAMETSELAKIAVPRSESIAADFSLLAGRVANIFGLGPTINVAGAYFGTDKIGHFFSQGRKFYRRYLNLGSEAKAARWSAFTERAIFGRLTTGVYSNADLVANYEGYLFYRGLFHDGVVAGKPAVFQWAAGRPVKQREFTWADHVNDFWDELLNPNDYNSGLLRVAKARLLRLCDDYRRRPGRYRSPQANQLFERYRHVGVVDTRALSPSRVLAADCPRPAVR